MAETSTSHDATALILQAIRQKHPGIQPGHSFDWLIIRTKLRQALSPEEFVAAMTELGEGGLIGADDSRRAFVLTEKGFEALH